MQIFFQFFLVFVCFEYNRLDDFQKFIESCCLFDVFERIDLFSVQLLDSRSVSEINLDDELLGKGYVLVFIIVNFLILKNKIVEFVEGKFEEEVNETLIIFIEDIEMEESGRSVIFVNCEQFDILVFFILINEGYIFLDKVVEEGEVVESQLEVFFEKEDVCKVILENRRGVGVLDMFFRD